MADAKPPRRLGLAWIVVLVLAVVAVFMLLPSARASRRDRARKELTKNYLQVSPAEMEPVTKATLVTDTLANEPLLANESAFIYVWAPIPSSTYQAGDLVEFLQPQYFSGAIKPIKKAILIAPQTNSPGWTLLGKLMLAYGHQKKLLHSDVFGLQGNLGANPKSTMQKLEVLWSKIPEVIQSKVEKEIEANREIFYKFQKTGRFFQTGDGEFYRINDPDVDRFSRIVGDSFSRR